MIAAGAAGALFVLWVALNLKTSRPDGTLLPVHPYRTMLTFLMPTRNESVVYFDAAVPAERLLAYVERARSRFHCDVTHVLVGAAAVALAKVPKMNRFVMGHRLYQRTGCSVTFSMKRKKLDREAKLAAVKLETLPGETFADVCARINDSIGVERSDDKTYVDKELSLLLAIPRPVLRWSVRLFRWLDYHNVLPGDFIANDAMYTSIFIANLGSLGMGAGYHHLYEWGNCPLFLMVGQVEERAVVEDGKVVVRTVLPVRFTYDERIDDGLNARFGIDALVRVLEDPFASLGCVEDDGSDAHVISELAESRRAAVA
jgi:hypothetical protein